jgi:magnesium-transporting ATPase (P-type)
MLTGESLAVTKTTAPVAAEKGVGDRKCMAFSATLVQQGQGLGLVVATGDLTAIGSINALVQGEAEKPSSLQVQLELFGRWVTIITLLIGIAAFLLAFFYSKTDWAEAFRASVAIAVAIIPEGLPAVVTITMALGVSNMASKKAIVRKLPAVETLGSVSTVCSDKTGTLTKNEMTAVELVTAEANYTVKGVGYDPRLGKVLSSAGPDAPPVGAEQEARLRALVLSAVLPNDGGLSVEGAKVGISGDPTDVAPLVLFEKLGGSYTAAQAAFPKLGVVPFESLHKWQAVLVEDKGVPGGRVVHLKGAPERLIPLCGTAVAREDAAGAPAPIDAATWTAKAAALSSKGLRVLALARWVPDAAWDSKNLTVEWIGAQSGALTLVGLVAILDPPRDECIQAIREFHAAGIEVKMITGDHPQTAVAIGAALGLCPPGGEVHTGCVS